jgi:ATP-dependent DNA helicase RecG
MIVRNLADLKKAMALPDETEQLEFKESGGGKINWYEVEDYCAVIANEGGGSLVLGVTNKKPRRLSGVTAKLSIDEAKKNLFDILHMRVAIYAITERGNTAYSFVVPGRLPRRPFHSRGKYQMRAGSHLRPMTVEELQKILSEGEEDFTANVVPRATIESLDPEHIAKFHAGCVAREQRNNKPNSAANIAALGTAELLESTGLTTDGKPTYAGLIMVGKKRAIFQHLPHAEIIFEYRNANGIEAQQRAGERDGFIASADVLWAHVNLRNDAQPYQEGLFKHQLRTFDEATIREALCNAVCHRDYRDQGSVFVRQYPQALEVESPGAFPEGVTAENILTQSKPRNRRLAEAMEKCGLVERSGQGIDLMYEQCVIHSRPLPDWSASDNTRVIVRIRGEVTDPRIVRFFERVSASTLRNFTGEDFLTVDLVRRKQTLPARLKDRAKRLVDLDVLERAGPGFRLSQRMLSEIDSAAVKVDIPVGGGLSMFVLSYIRSAGGKGASASELMEVTGRTRDQIRFALEQLKKKNEVHTKGRGAGARWHDGPAE